MTLRCGTCGYSAEDPSFFRREKGGVLRRTQTVCDACSAYQPTQRERRATTTFLLWQPIWLIGAFAFSHDDPSQTLGLAVLLLGAALSLPLAIATHEFGHALAAAAVGRRVLEVIIGSGPVTARLRIAGIDVTARRYVLVGGMMRSFADTDARSPWRDAAVLVAGAAANATIALSALLAVTQLRAPAGSLGIVISSLLAAIALVNAGMAAINLLPWKIGGLTASDGLRILNLSKPDTAFAADNRQLWRLICLTELGRFESVETESAAAARSSHFGPLLVTLAMNAISKQRGPRAAMDWYLAQAFDPDTLAPFSQADVASARAMLKASVAWDALETGRPELRELADTFSREAHKALPEMSAVRGTRGAVLNTCCEDAEGLDMLLQAARAATANEEKADFCGALASGLRKRGQEARATGFEAVSARFRVRMAAQYR